MVLVIKLINKPKFHSSNLDWQIVKKLMLDSFIYKNILIKVSTRLCFLDFRSILFYSNSGFVPEKAVPLPE